LLPPFLGYDFSSMIFIIMGSFYCYKKLFSFQFFGTSQDILFNNVVSLTCTVVILFSAASLSATCCKPKPFLQQIKKPY
jgi:hypothetical protein